MARSRLKTAAFALVPTIVVLGALEWIARLPPPPPRELTPREKLGTRASDPALTTRPWFGDAFAASWVKMVEDRSKMWFSRDGIIFHTDVADPFYNVVDGRRATTDVPPSDARETVRVFVLGGSTTFCVEVPDHETWPSFLQRALNASAPARRFEVWNLGTDSIKSAEEATRLEWEIAHGHTPQVVVFWDGVNDVVQGIYYGDAAETMAREEKRRREQLESSFLWKLAHASKLVERAVNFLHRESPTPPAVPEQLRDPARARACARETADAYVASMLRARAACEKCGAKMAVFLQPWALTKKPRTEHDRRVEPETVMPGLGIAFEHGYSALRESLATLGARGVRADDATSAFDAISTPIFFDFCHVNDVANERIAARVAPVVLELADERSRPK